MKHNQNKTTNQLNNYINYKTTKQLNNYMRVQQPRHWPKSYLVQFC